MVDARQTVSDTPTPAGLLECIVVTPEATAVRTAAKFVALPMFDGELGVAPLHSPFIGRLGYGELRIIDDHKVTQRYYLDGGFVQVANNVVSVLTGRAIPAEQLKPAAAEQQLEIARARPSNTPELMALRDKAEQQARAQLRVAHHVSGEGSSGH